MRLCVKPIGPTRFMMEGLSSSSSVRASNRDANGLRVTDPPSVGQTDRQTDMSYRRRRGEP